MFVFQESSRAAVDQWIDYLDDILGVAQLDRPLGIVLDMRESGSLPLAYITQRLRDLFANYDKRPTLRFAFISTGHNALILLIHLLAQIIASDDQNVVQYNQVNDEHEAVRWLFEGA
jgi:hypothetical protein